MSPLYLLAISSDNTSPKGPTLGGKQKELWLLAVFYQTK
jgi:hypothetical protein